MHRPRQDWNETALAKDIGQLKLLGVRCELLSDQCFEDAIVLDFIDIVDGKGFENALNFIADFQID